MGLIAFGQEMQTLQIGQNMGLGVGFVFLTASATFSIFGIENSMICLSV